MDRYDLVIIGCGPAGERAAIQAARAGKRVVVIEREGVVGGNRVNWGTIPSKTLRESALFLYSLTRNKLHGIRVEVNQEVTVADFMYRERAVVERELDLVNRSLARYAIEVVHGHGRFVDANTVSVERPGGAPTTLEGDVIIIATGSTPNRPADVPFDGVTVFDANTILQLPRMPRSLVVLGAGVIGVEFASMFAAIGVEVSLLDTRDRLLPYVDREIAAVFERELVRLGIVISHQERYRSIERLAGDPPRVSCFTTGGRRLEADALLYCVGRDGNSGDLGLETIDVVPDKYGLIQVNDQYQTHLPHVYAVGDVTGYPALASTSMEQGRRAVRHAFSLPGITGPTTDMPFAIYSIPEISFVGLSEETAKSQGVATVIGRGLYGFNARGQILGDHEGLLKLLFDAESGRLIGAHMVGTAASELIHIGQAFLRAGATAEEIADAFYNYPTLADLYRHAGLVAIVGLQRWAERE